MRAGRDKGQGTRVKALSLWQPWATLIAIGAKRFETRSWKTAYRGPLAIHAAKRWTGELRETALELITDAAINANFDPDEAEVYAAYLTENMPLGGVIATCNLTACHSTNRWGPPRCETSYGDYGPNRFAWQLENVTPLNERYEARGAQGLWEIELPADLAPCPLSLVPASAGGAS